MRCVRDGTFWHFRLTVGESGGGHVRDGTSLTGSSTHLRPHQLRCFFDVGGSYHMPGLQTERCVMCRETTTTRPLGIPRRAPGYPRR